MSYCFCISRSNFSFLILFAFFCSLKLFDFLPFLCGQRGRGLDSLDWLTMWHAADWWLCSGTRPGGYWHLASPGTLAAVGSLVPVHAVLRASSSGNPPLARSTIAYDTPSPRANSQGPHFSLQTPLNPESVSFVIARTYPFCPMSPQRLIKGSTSRRPSNQLPPLPALAWTESLSATGVARGARTSRLRPLRARCLTLRM